MIEVTANFPRKNFSSLNCLVPNFQNVQNQHKQKKAKTKCTKNHYHMLYCSWDMARDGCNFLPFYTAQKIKISKKFKKHLEISSFYTCVPQIMIKWCTVPEKWCATDGKSDKQWCVLHLKIWKVGEIWVVDAK